MVKEIKKYKISNQIEEKIIKCINEDNWEEIIEMIEKGTIVNLNKQILNGNNIFHLACIKGKTKIIKKILELKNNKKIKLNTNSLNIDGLPGLHLYYKYGGTEINFLKYDDICFLDNSNKNMVIYLLDKIDILEVLINGLIEKSCLDILELPDELSKYYLYYEIGKRVVEFSKVNRQIMSRYLDILKKLYTELKTQSIIFVGIFLNSSDIVNMLMKMDVDFLVYCKIKMTPLSMAVSMNHLSLIVMILEYTKTLFGDYNVFFMINASNKDYSMRPIFVANDNFEMIKIMISYMDPYIKYYEQTYDEKLFFKREFDNFHNTYLHRLLEIQKNKKVPFDILEFFVIHTDLNQPNYSGDTPAHLIFRFNEWKNIKELLKNREVDLMILDQFGKNCYSYINNDDKSIFMDLTKVMIYPLKLKNELNLNKLFDTEKIKEILNSGTNNEDSYRSKNYGLFNSNMPHYMLYLKYLETKYTNMYVPVRIYNDNSREKDLFFFELTSYTTSNEQLILNLQIENYMSAYYSYLPHNIYWIDDDQYYIDPMLIKLLKEHDKCIKLSQQRYVMLKLTIVVRNDLLHANILLYDRLKKEAWRFEPYGMTDITNGSILDKKVHKLLEDVYGNIKYYDPDQYLHGLNFQLVDGEEDFINKNLGDPGGYCLAWSIWFIDVVLANQDRNVDEIMINFFNKNSINTIISEEEGKNIYIKSTNFYLDFIRRYAHKLDQEKNKILQSIGVKKYNIYNYYIKNDVLQKISNIFKVTENC